METAGRAHPTRETWERAEVERSAREAAGIVHSIQPFTAANIRRYMDPPAATVYPLEYAFHLLGDATAKVVLDLGCGDGENTVMLALRSATVKALDISPDLLNVAQRRVAMHNVASRVKLMLGSAHDLPLTDESVDIVFGVAILHHLDLSQAAREVRRVLRTGGRGIFAEPVRNSAILKRARAMIPYRQADLSPFERPLTDDEIELFTRDFRGGRRRAFGLPHTNVANAFGLTGRVLNSCYRVDGVLLRTFPSLARYSSIKVFEITK